MRGFSNRNVLHVQTIFQIDILDLFVYNKDTCTVLKCCKNYSPLKCVGLTVILITGSHPLYVRGLYKMIYM